MKPLQHITATLAQIPTEVATEATKAGIEQAQKVQATDNTLPLFVGTLVLGIMGLAYVSWQIVKYFMEKNGGGGPKGREPGGGDCAEEIDELKDRVIRLEERYIYTGKDIDRLERALNDIRK